MLGGRYRLRHVCWLTRLFLLIPTIFWWMKGNDVDSSTFSRFATGIAYVVATGVLLTDASRMPMTITLLACALFGYSAATTATVTTTRPITMPQATLRLGKRMDSSPVWTSVSPQRKQSKAPVLAQQGPSADIEFVPLTREFIELLDDKDRYNRYATPNQYNGIATDVSMSMYIEGISSFSAQTMDYHLDMYFYQEWQDQRLRHNGTGPMLIRDKAVFKKLWHPDIYFANARHASFQEITEDNFLLWVYPSGRIWYDCRISLVAICMMDLWKYPLDSQHCELRILSFAIFCKNWPIADAYPESQLRLRWSQNINPPIDRNLEILMPDMRLVDIKTGQCNGTYATGKWSCMTAVFYVQREMMHHIIQTYVPTALIVVISWFNFWLDIDSAPARVSLSITTLLTIATQANAVKLALPEVSYMKAIDVWMGMCMAFVFSVMVEYTIAHFAKNQEMHRGLPNSNLLMDSTLSTLFDAAPNGGPDCVPPNAAAAAASGSVIAFGGIPYSSISSSTKTSQGSRDTVSGSMCRGSVSDRVRDSMKQKRRSISAFVAPLRNAVDICGNGVHSLRADEAEPLHMILKYPPLATEYENLPDNTELLSSDDLSLNNGVLQNSSRQVITTTPTINNANDRNNNNNSGDINSKNTHNPAPSEPMDVRLQATRTPSYLDETNDAIASAAATATINNNKMPVNFSLTDEEESEIVVVRKRPHRDTVRRIRKQVGRRAQEVRKSLCNFRGRAMANKIDQKSRIVFPCSFILFNIIYWSYYLVYN